jgi:predicted nucleic acid-binding protein
MTAATPSVPLLLDTNLLIYHLNMALLPQITQQLGEALKMQQAFISVITRIEMLAWKGHTDESLRQTTNLIEQLPELALSEAVIAQAIRIRKAHALKLPDAVIAATALAHSLQLVTANEADFKRVDGLSLFCV